MEGYRGEKPSPPLPGGGAKGKEEKELEDHTGDTPESKFAHTKHELRMDTRVVSMI